MKIKVFENYVISYGIIKNIRSYIVYLIIVIIWVE